MPTCFITCPKSFCVTGAILLRRFQKIRCIFRGKCSTLETSVFILRRSCITLDAWRFLFLFYFLRIALSGLRQVVTTCKSRGSRGAWECHLAWQVQHLVKICRVWIVILWSWCSIWDTLHFTLYTQHCTLYTLHTLATPTLHFTLYTFNFTLHTLHSTLYTLLISVDTLHSTLYTLRFTLYTLHSTLCTLHFTLHTLHFILYTWHCALYTLHCTLHTLHFTLSTSHFTLHTLHFTRSVLIAQSCTAEDTKLAAATGCNIYEVFLSMCFDICTITKRVSIRVRGPHLVST